MRLLPHAFNSFSFQQATKVASDWSVKYDWNIQGISTRTIERSQNFPLFASKNYAGNLKVIIVNFNDVDPDKNDLIIAMDVLGEDQHQLISTDEFGRLWYVNAVCIGLNEEVVDGNVASFGVVFEVDDPIWKLYTPSEEQILVNLTGSGTITPIGNQEAYPIITITPTVAGSYGFAYKRFVSIINNAPNALTSYPLNLTGAGLDTAALISGGKMLANGDDLRIYVDGVEVKRWFGGGGINSATTKIWINLTQPANSNMTLGLAIAGAGNITEIYFQNTAENIALMPTIPISGNVKIGSEIFVYTGVNVGSLKLTGVTRAERQTSAGAHSVADVVYFVTHDIWMYYGYPAISPYVVDDTNKPMIDMNSTNTSWVYTDFGTVAALRSGEWTQGKIGGGTGAWAYTAPDDGTADPYTVLGLISLNTSGLANIYWILYNPCGFTTVTATGKKYRSVAASGSWPYYLFSKGNSGGAYTTVWTEAIPAGDGVNEDLSSHAAVALGGTYPYLKFEILNATGGVYRCEIRDLTGVVDSAKAPTIAIAAEASNFVLNSVLTNAATGYSMTISMPMVLNTTLTVNTKEKTITLYDGTNQINALIDMPVRLQWFPLLPSEDNLITITDAGQVTYDFSFEDRSL